MGKRILRRWGVGIGLLLLIAACILAALRRAGPDAAQEQALQTLAAAAPAGRHNAFAPLWVLGRDVPAAEFDRVLAADDASLALEARGAAAGYPGLPVPPPSQRCGLDGGNCLQKMRAQVADPAAWLLRHSGLLRQLAMLERADHYRQPLPAQVQAPIPAFHLLALLPTARAVQFAGGEQALAVEATCRDLQGWRRLSARSDSLTLTMLATRAVGGSIRLLADMQVEAPPDAPWPPACEAAIAPLEAGEADLCAAMHGEMAYARASMAAMLADAQGSPWYRRVALPLLLDTERSLGAMAQARMRLCGEAAATAVRQDDGALLPAWQPPGFLSRTCLGNTGGCILLAAGEPVFTAYLVQKQDAHAQLQLLRTWRWLRTQPLPADGQALAAALARVPADVGVPRRAVVLADEGRALAMPLKRQGAEAAHWQLPLARPQAAAKPA